MTVDVGLEIIELLARTVLVVVFLFSGLSKALELDSFQSSIARGIGLAPIDSLLAAGARPIAAFVCLAEIVTAILLFTDANQLGAFLSVMMLSIFTAFIFAKMN